jgi:hypothetical protein
MLAPPPPTINNNITTTTTTPSSSSTTTMTSYLTEKIRRYTTTRNLIYAGITAVSFLAIGLLIFYMLDSHVKSNKRELRKLEAPLSMIGNRKYSAAIYNNGLANNVIPNFATAAASTPINDEYTIAVENMDEEEDAINMTNDSVNFSTTALFQARPFSASRPDDYFGIIEVSSRRSAVLTVNLSAKAHGYSEVVVYRYPEWTVAYADTYVTELAFDFLPHGNYTAIVYAVAPVEGVVETCRNKNRPAPAKRSHRVTNRDTADNRNASTDSVVSANAPAGSYSYNIIPSKHTNVWPGTVFTRVETINTNIDSDVTGMFISVPSYGFVVEGANKHLGSLIHEGNNTAIYRVLSSHDSSKISITVVYPDMDPKSIISPSTCLYTFKPPPSSIDNNNPPNRLITSSSSESE